MGHDVYPLPLQDESNGIEANRLHLQHEMVKKAINGLYDNPQLVKDALSPKADGSRRRVLDVGTGPGSWAIDMAKEFPDIDVLAFDLSPPVANKSTPPNCRFVPMDLNSGQLKSLGIFDVIHARAVATGCKDWLSNINEMAEILRPGGVLLIFDPDVQLFDHERRPLTALAESEPGFTWLGKYSGLCQVVCKDECPGIFSHNYYKDWFSKMDWYSSYAIRDMYLPVGPWDEKGDVEVMNMQREDALSVYPSLAPLLLRGGHSQEDVDLWISKMHEELTGDPPTARMYWRVSAMPLAKHIGEIGGPDDVDCT